MNSHKPDSLACVANLSADEVFTSPKFAAAMLDLVRPRARALSGTRLRGGQYCVSVRPFQARYLGLYSRNVDYGYMAYPRRLSWPA